MRGLIRAKSSTSGGSHAFVDKDIRKDFAGIESLIEREMKFIDFIYSAILARLQALVSPASESLITVPTTTMKAARVMIDAHDSKQRGRMRRRLDKAFAK